MGVNEHEVYIMVGWHDFWRVVDIDPNIYDIVAERFYPAALAYADERRKQRNMSAPTAADGAGSHIARDNFALAKDHFNKIEKELVKDLEVLDDEYDVESVSFAGEEARNALEGWLQIRGIMEKTHETVREVKPSKARLTQLRNEILENLNQVDSTLKESLDVELYKKIKKASKPFIKDLKNADELQDFTKTLNDLLDKELQFILKTTVKPYLNKVKEAVKDLSLRVVIERPKTNKELTKIEDKALEKLRIVRDYLMTFRPEVYEQVWDNELELLERNILLRRKLNEAGRAHHLRGSGSLFKKASGDKESKLPVALFLDMFGHYFLYLRIMNFIKIHDIKYITPETREGQIAQDADMLDGIGAKAVERTDDVGMEYGDKYWDEAVPLAKRKSYIESGGGVPPPDTMTVILSLCYCWPLCLNTQPAKDIVKRSKDVEFMEKEIIRYSRKEKGLVTFQIKKLRKLMRDFKKMAPVWVAAGKKKAPERAKELEMTELYWE